MQDNVNVLISFLLLVLIRKACITITQHCRMQENVNAGFSFLLLVSIREARTTNAQPFGMQGNAYFFSFPFWLWFQSERHTRLLRSSPGCRRMQKIFGSFLISVSIREARIATAQHSGMQENQQGLANKIDRAQNARTRIVQSHGIRVCARAVL